MLAQTLLFLELAEELQIPLAIVVTPPVRDHFQRLCEQLVEHEQKISFRAHE